MPRSILSVAACVLSGACSISTHVPNQVSADGLLAIQRGMTYEEVESLIGPPLCVVSVEDTQLSEADQELADGLVGGCGPLQRTVKSVPVNLRQAADLSVSYAEPRESLIDPNIYIGFSAGHVVTVYIKKGDLGICCKDGLPGSPFYGRGSRELLHDLVGR